MKWAIIFYAIMGYEGIMKDTEMVISWNLTFDSQAQCESFYRGNEVNLHSGVLDCGRVRPRGIKSAEKRLSLLYGYTAIGRSRYCCTAIETKFKRSSRCRCTAIERSRQVEGVEGGWKGM